MSEIEEDSSLLANMDENEEVEDEQSAAMRQMMGFSSFGGPQKPKRQPKIPGLGRGFGTGANSQPLQPRAMPVTKPSTTVLSATSHPFIPASLPPRSIDQGSITPQLESQPPTTTPFTTLEATASPSQMQSDNSFPSAIWNSTEPAQIDTSSFNPSIPQLNQRFSQTSADLDSIGYLNPKTGYSLTRRELQAYERGVTEPVMNNDGSIGQVKVYFKPNFIEDNPWEALEVAAAASKMEK